MKINGNKMMGSMETKWWDQFHPLPCNPSLQIIANPLMQITFSLASPSLPTVHYWKQTYAICEKGDVKTNPTGQW